MAYRSASEFNKRVILVQIGCKGIQTYVAKYQIQRYTQPAQIS